MLARAQRLAKGGTVVAALACVIAWTGCSNLSDQGLFDPIAQACTPNQTEPCKGPTSCNGHRSCLDDRSDFGACMCDQEDSGAGGSGGSSAYPDASDGGDHHEDGDSSIGAQSPPDAADANAEPASKPCPAGAYSGTFDGMYTSSAAPFSHVAVTGSIKIHVDEHGAITGTFEASKMASMWKADIGGTVDCDSGEVHGTITNGQYQAPATTTSFEGTLTGSLGDAGSSFSGQWTAMEPVSPYGGQGSWSAMR